MTSHMKTILTTKFISEGDQLLVHVYYEIFSISDSMIIGLTYGNSKFILNPWTLIFLNKQKQ